MRYVVALPRPHNIRYYPPPPQPSPFTLYVVILQGIISDISPGYNPIISGVKSSINITSLRVIVFFLLCHYTM